MLEDDPGDVLRKAMTGCGLDAASVAHAAGIPAGQVDGFLSGDFDPVLARALAPVVALDAEALAGLPVYDPPSLEIAGIVRLGFPFPGGEVNVWLLDLDGALVLIDAGYEPDPVVDAVLARAGRLPDMVVVTHGHHDHVGAVDALVRSRVPVFGWSISGAAPCHPGDELRAGGLTLRACDLSGHAEPALGFHIDGLDRPVLAVGDAVFAGSIGRCRTPTAYRLALATIGQACAGLSEDTALLTGHGPAATLGDERRSNPFLVGRI